MHRRRFRLLSSILLVLLLLPSVLVGGCTEQAWIIEDISTDEARTMIEENDGNIDFVILDVRTPEEYVEGHIANSLNIDFKSDTFREDVDQLDKNKTYLVYCRSGVRSAGARDTMEELGFKEVYNMEGGILDWEAKGLPVVK